MRFHFLMDPMSGEYVIEVYQGDWCNSLAEFGDDFRPLVASRQYRTINT